MSPILVRPVREQLEHDRIIRTIQTKFKRRFDASINPGAEQNTPAKLGTTMVYPDLLLFSQERGHRLQAVVEVETGESVNHLEALAQWVQLAKLRAAFFLYVPAGMVDVARRLCEDNRVVVNEIWSYHTLGDQVRFTLVHRSREASSSVARPARRGTAPAAARRKPASRPSKPARRSTKPAQSARARKRK